MLAKCSALVCAAMSIAFVVTGSVAGAPEDGPGITISGTMNLIRQEGTDFNLGDALARWFDTHIPVIGANAVQYRFLGPFFEHASGDQMCSWPVPDSTGSYSGPQELWEDLIDGGYLSDAETDPDHVGIQTFASPNAVDLIIEIVDGFTGTIGNRRYRHCPTDPDRLGPSCELSYDAGLACLREFLRAIQSDAGGASSDAWSHVRGIEYNAENHAWPRTDFYCPEGCDARRFWMNPGFCDGDKGAFLNLPQNHQIRSAIPGWESLDLGEFLDIVEFDFPELDFSYPDPLPAYLPQWFLFGRDYPEEFPNDHTAVAQKFAVDDPAISRVDLLLRRSTPADTFPGHVLTYLARVSDGEPVGAVSQRTMLRPYRSRWLANLSDAYVDSTEWWSFYVDPDEAQALFSVGDSAAFVVELETPEGLNDYGFQLALAPERQSMPGLLAGHGPRTYQTWDTELSVPAAIRVWHSTRQDLDSHASFVSFASQRLRWCAQDIRDVLTLHPTQGLSDIEIWCYQHLPNATGPGAEMKTREWYGTDMYKEDPGKVSFDVFNTFVFNPADAESLIHLGSKPVGQMLWDAQKPSFPWGWLRQGVRGAFFTGNAMISKQGQSPTAWYPAWRDSAVQTLIGVTRPMRLFPEHYLWAAKRGDPGDHVPDYLPGYPTGGLETLVSVCREPVCTSEDGLGTGHVLVSNTSSQDRSFDIEALIDGLLELRSEHNCPAGGGSSPFRLDSLGVAVAGGMDTWAGEHGMILCTPSTVGDQVLGPATSPTSTVVIRSGPPSIEPCQLVPGSFASSYCTDDDLAVKWRSLPFICRAQCDLDEVLFDAEVWGRDNLGVWHLVQQESTTQDHWYPYPFTVDSLVINLCGGWPPGRLCYQYLGHAFRVDLHSQIKRYGVVVHERHDQSETFIVYDESGSPCSVGGGGCPFVGVVTSAGHVFDNSALGNSGLGDDVSDSYHLRTTPAAIEGQYRTTLQETEQDTSAIDRVRLRLIEHRPSVLVAVSREGQVYPYAAKSPALWALDDGGADVLTLFTAEGDTSYHGFAGDYVVLNFGSGAEAPGDLYMISDIKEEENSVLVQEERYENGSLGWFTVASVNPRKDWGEDVIDRDLFSFGAEDSVKVRLYWTDEHKVDVVALIPPVQTEVHMVRLPPIDAFHSREGEVLLKLLTDDAREVPLGEGDVLYLTFPAPPPRVGWVREFVFETSGWWMAEDGGAQGRKPATKPDLTTRVRGSGPNPARAEVVTSLTLGEPGYVTARVFDIQGRVVRVLADDARPAGDHELRWDGRDGQGQGVAPGVYFVRVLINGRELYSGKIVRIE